MNSIRMAVLLTCHNRKRITLACLSTLYKQELMDGVYLHVYLVDDGSTDGTGNAVRRFYPNVKVLQGNGKLYWCGGMRLAWAEAIKGDYDYYLWLNDDTRLLHNALKNLIQCTMHVRSHNGRASIIVGSLCDPETGHRSYGGYIQPNIRRPLNLCPVVPSDTLQHCDTFNGNCVLVSKKTLGIVGNLSPEFTHAIADNDYGLRAHALGVKSFVAPGYVGMAKKNLNSNLWSNPKTTLRERWKLLHSPKGLPPLEWKVVTQRHGGWIWLLYCFNLYLKVLFPKLWKNLKIIYKYY